VRILYLLDDFPYPPDNGARIKSFNLISYMSRRHECDVLAFSWRGGADSAERLAVNQPGSVRVLGVFPVRRGPGFFFHAARTLLQGNPVPLARCSSRFFAASLQRALETTHYDLVHIEGLAMAPYVRLSRSTPCVISTTDAISLRYARTAGSARGLRRPYLQFNARSIQRFERKCLPLAAGIHCVSEVDSSYLSSIIPARQITVIECALTEEVYNYSAGGLEPVVGRVVLTAPLRYPHTWRGALQFLDDAFPAVLASCPDAELIVLGRNAPPALRLAGRLAVKAVAWAPDYCAEICAAEVVVIPDVAGSGIKNRVLQAMALARPVVGSPVAFEALPVQDGVHCFLRPSPAQFAEAVAALLKNKKLRTVMGNAGRQLVRDKYAPDLIGSRWEALYRSVIADARSTACASRTGGG